MAAVEVSPRVDVIIKPPAFQTAVFTIVGTAPYCQNKFSHKAKEEMISKQKEGQKAKKGKARDGKDFEQCFKEAQYRSREGWHGIPASSFRNAMISACRIIGFKMTLAKLGVFIEADGFDVEDGTPLVKLEGGEPVMRVHPVRNASGVIDLRPRPFWDEWKMSLRVTFDADMFGITDIANLLARVGRQVGIGEGRPDSKMSAGQGWGLFKLEEDTPTNGKAKK